MYDFKLFVENKDLMEDEQVPPVPPNVDPGMWANKRWRDFWFQSPEGRAYIAQQGQQQPVLQTRDQPVVPLRRVARALSPVQGQTGSGLESIPAGGRVPSHLVNQIPSGDIAPGWETATKFFKGRDGQVYKK